MKQIIFIILVSLFFVGCESDEEKSNKIFSENVGNLNKFLSEGVRKDNVNEMTTIKDKIKGITIKYPNTNLSVGLLSGNTKIGEHTLSETHTHHPHLNPSSFFFSNFL